MNIRLFCYRCFVFLGLWIGYKTQNGNQTTHQRTDDVEEAEGEINQSRDAKNCTLRHTAGSPWNQHARHGSTILCTSTQEFWSVTSFSILILVDRCIHDNTQELVTHYEIEQDARCHGTADKRDSTVDAFQEHVGDGVEHAAGYHT